MGKAKKTAEQTQAELMVAALVRAGLGADVREALHRVARAGIQSVPSADDQATIRDTFGLWD